LPLPVQRITIILLFLGVAVVGTVNLALRRDFGLETRFDNGAVVVRSVAPGSSVAAAGIQPGDRLLRAGGRDIVNQATARWALKGLYYRQPVALVWERNGERFETSVATDTEFGVGFILLNSVLGLTFLVVGLLVWWSGSRDPTLRAFFRLTTLVGIAILLFSHESFLVDSDGRYVYALTWLFVYTLIPAALVDFLIRFVRHDRAAAVSTLGVIALYLPPAALFGLETYGYFKAWSAAADWNAVWITRYETLFNTGFSALLLVYFVAGVALLAASWVISANQAARDRARWLCLCTIIGLTPFIFFYKGPMALGLSPLLPLWAALGMMLIVPIGWGMAVTSFRMFRLEWVLSRTITYTVAVITVIYLLLLISLFGADYFRDRNTGSLAVLSLIGALVLLLAVLALSDVVRRLIDRLYYRDWFNYRQAVGELGNLLSVATTESQAVEILTERLPQMLKVVRAELFVHDSEVLRRPTQRGRSGCEPETLKALLSEQKIAISILSPSELSSVECSQRLAEAGIELLVPLRYSGALTGLLLLGGKLTGAPFSVRDRLLLEALSSSAGTTLANIALTRRLIDNEKRALVADMAGGIAHEINNALAPLMGQAQLMEYFISRSGTPPDPAHIKQPIGIIVDMSLRIKRIAQNLNRIAEPPRLEVGPFLLNQVVEETLLLLTETAGRIKRYSRTDTTAPYRLSVDLDPEIPVLHGDAQQIGQALLNLIINACDAMEPLGRGTLTVGTRWLIQQGVVLAYIADTGPGIPPELSEKIFQPYFTTKEKGKGTGLGLAIVRTIIEAHSGSINLISSDSGGARFEFILPVESPTHAHTPVTNSGR
jgi:signal transduction histidine kinase